MQQSERAKYMSSLSHSQYFHVYLDGFSAQYGDWAAVNVRKLVGHVYQQLTHALTELMQRVS